MAVSLSNSIDKITLQGKSNFMYIAPFSMIKVRLEVLHIEEGKYTIKSECN